MNESLSFQDNDEIDEHELDLYVNNVISDAQASLANVIINVGSTSAATLAEEVMTICCRHYFLRSFLKLSDVC